MKKLLLGLGTLAAVVAPVTAVVACSSDRKEISVTLKTSMTDAEAVKALEPFTKEAKAIDAAVAKNDKGDDDLYHDTKNLQFLKAFAIVTIKIDDVTFVYDPYKWYAAISTTGETGPSGKKSFEKVFDDFMTSHKIETGAKYFDN